MNKKEELVIKVLNKFEKNTGIKFSIVKHLGEDINASITLELGKKKWCFDIGIQSTINSAVVGQMKHNLSLFKGTPLLITSYVTPNNLDLLKSSHINFIDAAGNALIEEPPLIVLIQGCKPDKPISSYSRLYRSSGLKTVFTLLSNPGLENSDYRTISSMSNVALGSVGWIMRDLRQNGYLARHSKKMFFLRKKELLDNWVTNYCEQLRPKCFIGRYGSIDRNWGLNNVLPEGSLWGAEPAAKILTSYLNPELYTIYTKEVNQEFLIKNRMHKTTDGNVEIIKKFWNFNDLFANQLIVPPLLIYADLIASRSDRNIETAKVIYEKEIAILVK